MEQIKLFISYSHDDDPYFKVFSGGLKKVIKNTEHFEWSIWDDTQIYMGTFWDDEIQNNIQGCNVAMLLVSVGFMASQYIKEKEYNEFIKRYKEKGILIVPIVFAPCDFNRWEDLGKLQFYKPKGSSYGKSEIENFTYADLIEFKRTDGTLLPNTNIDRYHLALVKKIEASFKEFLDRKEKEEIVILSKPLPSNFNKLSDYPKPGSLFTGRKTESKNLKKIFESFRIIAIEGIGGTGKTQFAAKCIEEMITDKNKIIWLNGSMQSNFDVFVENSGYGDVLKGEKKTDLALYSGLKDLIERDERVIFWDNYNDYEDPAFSKFLSFAHQYLQKATVILITKTEPSIDRITSLPIIRLEGLDEDAVEYAKKLKASNVKYSKITDSDLLKICMGVDGHPLAIEFSMWLMGYGKSVDDIMLHMPEFSGLKKVEEFSKRLFLDIFNHSSTTEEERECFLKCSVFKEKIKEGEIKFLYDGKDVFHLLAGLMDKLLISSKEGFYEMHPLVRSFSYEKLSDKKAIHKKAADYFISQRDKTLNALLEEKIFYHLSEAEEWEIIADSIEITGREFIQQGQLGLINEFMNKVINTNITRPIFEIFFGDIAQIKGEWDKARSHFEKASQNNEDNTFKTEGMIKYGEMFYRRGDINESLPYFEEAYTFAKTNFLYKEEAQALNDIGLVCFAFDEEDKAYEKHMEALKIRKKINDSEGVAISLSNIARIFTQKKQYKKALEFNNESLKIEMENGNKIGLGTTLINIGIVLRYQNKFDEALQKANSALKIFEEIGHKEAVSDCLNSIGLIFLAQGKLEEGLLKHHESLKVKEEIGDKIGIAACFGNIGAFYFENKSYDKALYNFFKSFDLYKQTGNKAQLKIVFSWIRSINKKIGKEKFKELASQVYKNLEPEEKKQIELKDFYNEPQIRKSPKVGRNEPCPCGSGKKYKNCHGKND